jgi:hypothetical protein
MGRNLFLALLLTISPVFVLAQAGDHDAPPPPPPPEGEPAQGQPPAEAAPSEAPPPPPTQAAPAPPRGQWVSTEQYGWVWIPYGRQYTYIPGDPQVYPDQYVYYPAYGWRWVVAPWVYGYGPSPYWGPAGLRFFVWYSRPWFRVGGYWGWGGYRGWGHYRGWVGPRAWGPHGWVRAPPYYRSGVGGPHPGHFRAGPERRRPEREWHDRRPR